ncbi:MAG TPA: aminodeoxychorismate synthase component I [Thermoleophilaceae bacterium]|nr:aminodeoxychorismate synthase component I [Thermoleophilaceae bacterium]
MVESGLSAVTACEDRRLRVTTMKTLLIDNYDSFTYNLFQLLAEVNGELPEVVCNDAADWEELARRDFDNVVISPGPGRADDPADFGVCGEAVRRAEVPLLGVCLGHQGICSALGGRVEHAPEAVHGRAGAVIHDGSALFVGIPREFQAVRYHSLCAGWALPDELEPTAWASDGVLMAVAHRTRPLWGVQFHPESIATQHGRRLLANFRDLTAAAARPRRADSGGNVAETHPTSAPSPRRVDLGGDVAEQGSVSGAPVESNDSGERASPSDPLSLVVERLDMLADPEAAFAALYADSADAFWLDSARVEGEARFSFAGDASGPFGAVVTYDVDAGEVTVTAAGGVERHRETIFDYLRREQARLREVAAPPDLPFDFACGFAGYLGYELKADCGGDAVYDSPLPDAAFVRADRMLAFDHEEGHTYLLCLTDVVNTHDAERWIADTRQRLESLPPPGDLTSRSGPQGPAPAHERPRAAAPPGEFSLARSRERYLADIAVCKERLFDGETYEVCLTNQIATDFDGDPLVLYRELRRVNPAPYAAFLRFGGVAVLSSSPERFLRVGRDRWAEAKPIKGTARRGLTPVDDVRLAEELRTSEKDRAENLMITDLLRNDLGRVCEVGTVHVPHLMQVETYETVHQLVSTVRGLLQPETDTADCIRACFPPGSMTGAPKKRTMEIVDELEEAPRGVYSGAIGYLGPGGSCDLSVTIRTIVVADGKATIGVGGAIVTQSNADDEFHEALLKGEAPMRAVRGVGEPLELAPICAHW